MIRPSVTEFSRKRVFDDLCVDEGVEYKIYLDHLGYPTFGVGHYVKPEDPEYGMEVGTEVSEERVWEAFETDLDDAIIECKHLYPHHWHNFPPEIQEILTNMMFNMGRPRLSGFRKMNEHLESADWRAAAAEGRDSKWYRQVTNRAERLMVRMENVA